MPAIAWKFRTSPGGVDLTSQVMSFSRMRGKQNWLEPYGPKDLTITIRNDNNQAASWPIAQAIEIYFGANVDDQIFWVDQIEFNDAPGTTATAGSGAGSTATIILRDWLGRGGQMKENPTLSSAACFQQIRNGFTTAGGTIGADMGYDTTYNGTNIAAASTTSTNVTTRLVQNVATDKYLGQIYLNGNLLMMRPGNLAPTPANLITLKPSKGVSTGDRFLVYDNCRRITAGPNFCNAATVSYPGGSQSVTNAASIAIYSTRLISFSTVDNVGASASDKGRWLIKQGLDPAALSFEVTFTDVMQTNNVLTNLLTDYATISNVAIEYVVPGSGVTKTEYVTIEGISYSADPGKTSFTMYLSNLNLYSPFTLDSVVCGYLDQNYLA